MDPALPPSPLDAQQLCAAVRMFIEQHYEASGALRFGIDADTLAALVTDVVNAAEIQRDETSVKKFLVSLHLEDLVLARGCENGDERAWELFLTRYRTTLYESAYKIAREEGSARSLADSLYAELYGVDAKGQQRVSKLRYYHGRGSLQGWLRTIVAQEFVNRYRSTKRETSLDAALEEGAQFPEPEPEAPVADKRVDAATNAELAVLSSEERLLLVAYYLDHRTLAEIAKLLGVHESTISRKLGRTTRSLRKRIGKRLVRSGMSRREAEEAMAGVDVRDLQVQVSETLRQESLTATFYKEKGESQG